MEPNTAGITFPAALAVTALAGISSAPQQGALDAGLHGDHASSGEGSYTGSETDDASSDRESSDDNPEQVVGHETAHVA